MNRLWKPWPGLLTLVVGLWVAQGSLAAESGTVERRRFALLVSTNDGGPSRMALRYANTDAAAMGRVLDELGGVASSNQLLLTHVTRAKLEEAFGSLNAKMAEAEKPGVRTEAVFYYSGHSDETGLMLGTERVSYSELRRWLAGLKADVRVAILDSCASGTLARMKGGTKVPSFLVDASNSVRGQAILTSSSADEASQESDKIGGSFFTHHLVSGLRGAADVSGDGRVTLNEAYQFAFHETLARTEATRGGAQHPAYDMELAGAGELVLTDLRATSALLEFAPALEGRLFIRDDAGTLVVELRKPQGRASTLGLAPGRYQVLREQQGEVSRADFEVKEGYTTQLGAAQFRHAPSELTALRGSTSGSESPMAERSMSPHDRVLNVGLVPGFSSNDVLEGPVDNTVSFGLVGTRVHALGALGMGVVFNSVETDAKGPLLSTAFNQVGRDSVLNLTAGVNFTQGDAKVNLSAGANWTSGHSVFDASAGLNHARTLEGAQLAAGVNILGEEGRGLQAAAGANIVSGPFVGTQLSSGVSFAEALRGAQISVVNIGGDVSGTQIGVVNLANRVSGLQLGVVNLAKEVSGASVGLLSLVQNGRIHGEVYASDWAPLNAELKLGSDRAYTYFSVGRGEYGGRVFRSLGAGLGAHFPMGSLSLDVDGGYHSLFLFGQGWDSTSAIAQARVTLAYAFWGRLSVFGGPTYNVGFPVNDGPVFQRVSWVGAVSTGGDVEQWPGAVLGLRF